MGEANGGDSGGILDRYKAWLDRQGPAPITRRAYRASFQRFIEFVRADAREYGDPFLEENPRNYATRDFRSHLKTVLHRGLTSQTSQDLKRLRPLRPPQR